EAVGNSGGILCVWEATVFNKDYATILDNFVAIYETWLPSNSKALFVDIYALQQDLKVRIRAWIKDKRSSVSGEKDSIKKELSDIDRPLDGGDVFDSNLLRRSELVTSIILIRWNLKSISRNPKSNGPLRGMKTRNFFMV
nr:RNA-directed DNA polymerase, eukaryota [Tanacetum cinerariifolium]